MKREQRQVDGVAVVIERNGRWLVIRRAEGVVAPGYWCFPGGAVEPGETPAQAVVREIREEVGLEVVAESELWRWQRPKDGLRLAWWQASCSGPDSTPLNPDPAEVAEARWVTPAELQNLCPLLPSNRAFLDQYPACRNMPDVT